MTDPLSLLPSDESGLKDGFYKRIPPHEIDLFLSNGWQIAPLNDKYFHPNDEHGVMMMWPKGKGEMWLP